MLHISNIFQPKSAAAALSLNEGEMERVMVIQKISTHPNLPRVNILVWYVILQAGCIYSRKECAFDVQSARSPRPLWEREQFQVEPGRNLEIRVRGLNNKKLPPRPITAFTSQVGEVAVVRALASYKCGWGSVKANPHPNRLEPSGKIYECWRGAENLSIQSLPPPYPLRVLPPQGGQMQQRSISAYPSSSKNHVIAGVNVWFGM